MDGILRSLAAIGFTPQEILMIALLWANFRLSFKMDKRIFRLEVHNNLVNKDESHHGN